VLGIALALELAIADAAGAEKLAQHGERGFHHRLRSAAAAEAVTPFDQHRLAALALLQRLFGAGAFEHRPGAVGDVAGELDLGGGPAARARLLDR